MLSLEQKPNEEDQLASKAIALDPYLWPHRYVLQARLLEIVRSEGSIDRFSRGYERFGFIVDPNSNAITYREWAPAAQAAFLIGDFSTSCGQFITPSLLDDWNRFSHPMKRNEFGVWEIVVPCNVTSKQPAIEHGSRIKISMIGKESAERIERIPAWIRRAEQNPKSKLFDGVFWSPPKAYEFEHQRPLVGKTLKIYETHIGIASNGEHISTYRHFTEKLIPYIKSIGYNAIQLMAIQEHPYYASFGYQVTSFFAPSSRFGTPEDLKQLIDRAHANGLLVFLDIVHSHASKNVLDGLNMFDGTDHCYFHGGPKGVHPLWDSRLFNYGCHETLRFLLSNLRYWWEEFRFDGFRFDGVTSILYKHHGIAYGFTGNYAEYYEGDLVDGDALAYLQLANLLCHEVVPAITVAEDVSGMPLLCIPAKEGGIGFDYRLGMSIPDLWVSCMKQSAEGNSDEAVFDMHHIAYALTNRRYREPVIAYSECHDQALVGDKTLAFWLMDAHMYTHMSKLSPPSLVVDRGIALLKLIRLITFTLAGDAYLSFMGNEFGHPEWLDFPRAGNGDSFKYARRLLHLPEDPLLRYGEVLAFERAILALPISLAEAGYGYISLKDNCDMVIVYRRGGYLFILNWHPRNSHVDYRIGVPFPGKYTLVLDTDAEGFGGFGRVQTGCEYFSSAAACHSCAHSIQVYLPSRTGLVLDCPGQSEWI